MPERSNISPHAFSGEEAWASLPAHVQARIGSFALELAVARSIDENVMTPAAERAAWEAERLVLPLLQEAALGYDGLRNEAWIDRSDDGRSLFRIPSCIGMVCLSCGCSHEDPCDGGCGWHADGLCTACAEGKPDAGVEAAAVPDLDHAEARAVVRGACRAVSASSLAEVQPMGSDLRRLAAAIDSMHAEIEGGEQ